MKIDERFKEVLAVSAVILGLIALQWRLWGTHTLSVTHDSIIWYGVFQYFVDNLHQGHFPFWNPYMNCGESFFLVIGNLRLMDPSSLFLIAIGKVLRIDFLTLYHYDLLSRYIIFICGAYFFFRHVAKYRMSAFIAFITISFSSLCTSYLRQHAFLLAFYLFPWILFFIVRFFEDRNPRFLLLTALFLGIALPSYHAMFTIVSIAILLASLLVSRGLPMPQLKTFFDNYKISLGAFLLFLLLVVRLVPLYLSYTHDIVPTARVFEAPIAAYSYPADFFNLLIPYSFVLHFFHWFYMSESFLYIGLIPFFLVIIGLWFSRHRYKWGFILTTIIVVLLMFGDKCFIYPLFRKILPGFSIIRNMRIFGTFFIFCLTYFTCLGADVMLEWLHTSKIRLYKKSLSFVAGSICISALLMNKHIFNILPSLIKNVNILYGYRSFTTNWLVEMVIHFLNTSYTNILLYVAGSIIIFSLLRRPKVNIRVKYFAIISFIVTDLFLFNSSVFNFVTMPVIAPDNVYSTEKLKNEFRTPLIHPKYPFYGFAPAMLKRFTAYSTKIPWITTHVYEIKDFFELVNNEHISSDVKDALTGVSSPKLQLIRHGMVLPRNAIIEELTKMDAKTAEKVIFIEEDLPLKYSHLQKPFDAVNNGSLEGGKIEVKSFNPNEIVMDVYTDEDSFLYYGDGFDKAWRVFINGKEGKIYKTNLAFKSVIIDKGNHRVRFIYDPKFYKFSLFCYFFGLSSLAIIFVYGIFRSRKNL